MPKKGKMAIQTEFINEALNNYQNENNTYGRYLFEQSRVKGEDSRNYSINYYTPMGRFSKVVKCSEHKDDIVEIVKKKIGFDLSSFF